MRTALAIAAAVISVVVGACSDTATAPETKYYPLRITMSHTFGDSAFVVNNPAKTFVNDAGNRLQFTNFKYLLTFVLIRSDGVAVRLPNPYGFIDLNEGRTTLTLDRIPAGKYKSIVCMVGVDSSANHGAPTQWAAGHALNPAVNNLHWSWAGGYIFVAMDGNYLPPSGANAGFSFHIGGDEYLTPHEVAKDVDMNTSRYELLLRFDVKKFFGPPNVYDLPRDGMYSHSENDGGIARKLVNNSSGAISGELSVLK